MEVITNLNINKKFKQIPEYKMDLGIAAKIDDSGKKGSDYASGGKWVIKDKAIKKYYDTFNRYLNRIGKIGTLLFYIDNFIKNNDIYIIHENELYKSEFDNSDIKIFLSNLIKKILDKKIEPYIKIDDKKEEIVDLKNMTNEELSDYLLKNR